MNSNIGLMFHKRIYLMPALLERLKVEEASGLIFSYSGKKDEDELAKKFESYHEAFLYKYPVDGLKEIENDGARQRFTLYTRYPGLLVGSGYPHETGTQGDFKMGYFFDHTSGQPVIPGSSVKGVLKNFLEEFIREIEDSNLEKIQNQVKELGFNEKKLNSVFGEQDQEGKAVFYDAVIKPGETRTPFFLSNDFITPHIDPFKNPNPNMFLKVLPNVAFEFRFDLDRLDRSEKPDELALLFKEILCTVGIGAKTNVGYGQFSEAPVNPGPPLSAQNPEIEKQPISQGVSIHDEMIKPTPETLKQIQVGTEAFGIITSQKGDNFLIKMQQFDDIYHLKKKSDKFKGGTPAKNKKVKVVFNQKGSTDNFTATIIEELNVD